MKNLALVTLFTALAASTAEAAPTRINFTGRLSTSAGPVNGSVNVTFKLFSAATGGTEAWSETQSGLGADKGLVFVELGAQTTLDTSVFTGSRMFLEITIGTETLSPRLAINSVPYAISATEATSAATLGGTIGPADVLTQAVGSGGIAAAKTGNTLNISLATTGCAAGHVFKYDGTQFSCQPDANTTYTGTGAIAVTGTTISLATTGCAVGEVWKFNGTGFTCSPDSDSGGDVTSVTASTGLSGGGTSGAVSLSVLFGGDGASNSAARSDHTHALSCQTVSAVASATADQVFVTCPSNTVVTGGGCNNTNNAGAIEEIRFSGNGYFCRKSTTGGLTTEARCCTVGT